MNFDELFTFPCSQKALSVSVQLCTLTDRATGGSVRKCAELHTYGQSFLRAGESEKFIKIHDTDIPGTGLDMAGENIIENQ